MTRNELEQVYYLNNEIKQREQQLNDLIESSQVKSPQITGMPSAHTNGVSDSVADIAVKIIEYTEIVNAYKDKLETQKRSIDRWVMSLSDSYLRQIVHYRCYELMGWTKIAQLMGTTADCVRMYYKRKIPKE